MGGAAASASTLTSERCRNRASAVRDHRPRIGGQQAASTSPRSDGPVIGADAARQQARGPRRDLELQPGQARRPERPRARRSASRRGRGSPGSATPRTAGASPARSASSAPDGDERASTMASAAATTVVPTPPLADQQETSTEPPRGGSDATDQARGKRCTPRWHRGMTGNKGRARRRATLSSTVVEAAFFDLDKTVIAKASMVAFGRPLYRAGLISRWILLRAVWGQLVYLQIGADEQRMLRMPSVRPAAGQGMGSGARSARSSARPWTR